MTKATIAEPVATIDFLIRELQDLDEAALAALRETPQAKEMLNLVFGEQKLDEGNYLWVWIERGLFCKSSSPGDALRVIAGHPSAPWKKGRWDVDHKSYAGDFYRHFPKAAAQ